MKVGDATYEIEGGWQHNNCVIYVVLIQNYYQIFIGESEYTTFSLKYTSMPTLDIIEYLIKFW